MNRRTASGPLAAFLLVLSGMAVTTMGVSDSDGVPPVPVTPGAFPMTGVLDFPAGWDRGKPFLLVMREEGGFDGPVDCLELVVPPEGGRVSFQTEPIIPGYYVLQVPPWMTTVKHAAGEAPLDLALPPWVNGTARFLDENSGRPIEGGSVSWGGWSDGPPPTSDATGEVRFRALPGKALLWARAPDHVTPNGEFVTFEPGVPFHREFRLRRAGAVRVILRSEGRPAEPESVWLYSDSGGEGMSVEAGEAMKSPVKPGTYSIGVKVGGKYEREADLPIKVVEGETTTVVVDLVPRTTAGDAARGFGGTLTFHPSWRIGETRMVLWKDPSDRSEEVEELAIRGLVPGRPSPFRFGALPPGRYVVWVGIQWTAAVEVPAPTGGCALLVPEPGEVLVRVLADEDGTPVRGARVLWHMKAGSCLGEFSEVEASEVRAGLFLVQSPPGEMQFRVEAPGRLPFPNAYTAEGADIVGLSSGDAHVREVRIGKAGCLKVVLRCGNQRLSREEADVLLREPPERQGPNAPFAGRHPLEENGAFVLDGIPTGSYPLVIYGRGDSFEDVPDREVVIRAGETTEVTVDLVRRK